MPGNVSLYIDRAKFFCYYKYAFTEQQILLDLQNEERWLPA